MAEQPKTCAEVLEEVREQIREYENLLEQILTEPKKMGTVVSDKFIQDNLTFYKVKIGPDELILNVAHKGFFNGEIPELIPKGTNVISFQGSIVGLSPDQFVSYEDTHVPLTSWKEIGGMKSQVERVRDIIEIPVKYAEKAAAYGLGYSKGLLLYGPPGCGKTLMAKAIASSILNATEVDPRAFIYIKGAEILSRYVGDTEQAIKTMFEVSRSYMKESEKQGIIFIDEAEALLPERGSRISSDVDTTIVATFLSEMDGFDDTSPFVMLSSNHPHTIDRAVLREGRIDTKVEVTRPDQADSVEIFAIHLNKVKCKDSIGELSRKSTEYLFSSPMCSNVSGAMIATITQDSARRALKRDIQGKGTGGIIYTDLAETIDSMHDEALKRTNKSTLRERL